MTGSQLSDTSIEQAHMQLSWSYIFGNADLAHMEFLETLKQVIEIPQHEKFWRSENETRDVFFFGKRSQEKYSATLMGSEFELSLFEASFLSCSFSY